MPMLYEATSPRDDHGVWALTYGQPNKTPFRFDWKGKTRGGKLVDFAIDTSCYVIIVMKERLSDTEEILKYKIQMDKNNCIMVVISEEDALKLRPRKTYHTTVTLYDAEDNLIRVLLRDLPTKILDSGVQE